MSTCLSDVLDATLARLRDAGAEIRELAADGSALERIFVERGEEAVLMDCDRSRDVAWYRGEVELRASENPGLSVIYVQDGHLLSVTVGTEEVSAPVVLENLAPAGARHAA
jgi:hypothetical protein